MSEQQFKEGDVVKILSDKYSNKYDCQGKIGTIDRTHKDMVSKAVVYGVLLPHMKHKTNKNGVFWLFARHLELVSSKSCQKLETSEQAETSEQNLNVLRIGAHVKVTKLIKPNRHNNVYDEYASIVGTVGAIAHISMTTGMIGVRCWLENKTSNSSLFWLDVSEFELTDEPITETPYSVGDKVQTKRGTNTGIPFGHVITIVGIPDSKHVYVKYNGDTITIDIRKLMPYQGSESCKQTLQNRMEKIMRTAEVIKLSEAREFDAAANAHMEKMAQIIENDEICTSYQTALSEINDAVVALATKMQSENLEVDIPLDPKAYVRFGILSHVAAVAHTPEAIKAVTHEEVCYEETCNNIKRRYEDIRVLVAACDTYEQEMAILNAYAIIDENGVMCFK